MVPPGFSMPLARASAVRVSMLWRLATQVIGPNRSDLGSKASKASSRTQTLGGGATRSAADASGSIAVMARETGARPLRQKPIATTDIEHIASELRGDIEQPRVVCGV